MAGFTFVDLFSGIGGFRLALEQVGGECVGFSEIAPDAIKTYCANFEEGEESNFGDITKLKDLPDHDFMTAGVPCQSWSIAGKNLGFDDDRGQLWNDTLYLLNKVRPKVFIFENVKGLSDPRNKGALDYIMERIRQAGYYAKKYLINAYDYGVPQTRVRIYIVGFKEEKYLKAFKLPNPFPVLVRLCDVLDNCERVEVSQNENKARWSLSCNDQGYNDYFLFNDLRDGSTTIHSWDIIPTTSREKAICYLLLKNRRKKDYGEYDGNPLSLKHFQELDSTIKEEELESLVDKKILKHIEYKFGVADVIDENVLSEIEKLVLALSKDGVIIIDVGINRLSNGKLTGDVDFEAATKNVKSNDFHILLSHEPNIPLKRAKDRGYTEVIDLFLSGHTHGLQISFLPMWVWEGLNKNKEYPHFPVIYGIMNYGKMKVYVTSGIGAVLMPFRLLAYPEVVIINLKRK